jgi:hypothetical protein
MKYSIAMRPAMASCAEDPFHLFPNTESPTWLLAHHIFIQMTFVGATVASPALLCTENMRMEAHTLYVTISDRNSIFPLFLSSVRNQIIQQIISF